MLLPIDTSQENDVVGSLPLLFPPPEWPEAQPSPNTMEYIHRRRMLAELCDTAPERSYQEDEDTGLEAAAASSAGNNDNDQQDQAVDLTTDLQGGVPIKKLRIL